MKWELETRTCKCGCGASWRCLPTSPNHYASVWHEHGYQKGSLLFDFDDQYQDPKRVGSKKRYLKLVVEYVPTATEENEEPDNAPTASDT